MFHPSLLGGGVERPLAGGYARRHELIRERRTGPGPPTSSSGSMADVVARMRRTVCRMAWRPPFAGEVMRPLVPEPRVLALCALVGLAAVLFLPDTASVLPWGDRPQPNEAQLAVTSLAVQALTAAYLYAVHNTTGLSAAWGILALAYNTAVIAVKFVLSPASYLNSPETTLAEHLWVGITVMLLYLVALAVIHAIACRNQHPPRWAWPSKLALVLALLTFAILSRYVAAVVLGRAASEYLAHVFAGAGLWLPLFIMVASWLAIEAFDRAARAPEYRGPDALRTALGAGMALIALYHGLWVVFMLRLF